MKIFIDPGHNYSGADTGATGYGLKEQDVTYNVAEKLSDLLKGVGVDVKMSRNKLTDNIGNTVNASINGRVKAANDWKADYFISLHCDAALSSLAKGSHICIYGKGGSAEKLANAVNPYLLQLGLEGRSEIIQIRRDLGVLRDTTMPAILIEMGFITNPHNSKLQKENPDKIAKAIFDGVCKFLNIKKTPVLNKPAVIKPDIKKATYRVEGTTHIVEVDPLNLGCYIADQRGDKINIANFVNGGYFMNQANGKTFAQHHLVDCGKILSNYATHGKPVTTLCVFYDGVVQVKKISDISLERGLKFAISGASLTDYKNEGFVGAFSDIARSTSRTYIGYRKSDNKIIICVRPNTSIARALETFKNLGVDEGITLDGGGSTCMRVNGDWKVKTTRQINSIVMWE